MNTITKAFTFAASHQLAGLPDGHKCSRIHGHNYTVELVITGGLDDAGMVYDYGRLDPFAAFIAEHVDHRHLNDLITANPTAEHLAAWFYDIAEGLLDLPAGIKLHSVRVAETPKTTAEYWP